MKGTCILSSRVVEDNTFHLSILYIAKSFRVNGLMSFSYLLFNKPSYFDQLLLQLRNPTFDVPAN